MFQKLLRMINTFYPRLRRKLVNLILERVLIYIQDIAHENDKNNDLNQVDNGFIPRKNDVLADPDKIRRIAISYQKAIASQALADDCYQVGGVWLPIYKEYMGEVMSALKAGNVAALENIYNNFFRHPCSTGLHGMPGDMKKKYFSGNISLQNKKLFLHDQLHRMKLWKGLLGDSASLDQIDSPSIGNPYGCYIDGHFVKPGSDYPHYYATCIDRMTSHIPETTKRVVVELGGGFGAMGHHFSRVATNKVYVDVDLPETLALASFYLMHLLPDKKIFLFGEDEFSTEMLGKYDIIMLPNFAIKNIPTNSTDLVFNSYSLSEMPKNTINCYIKELSRALKRTGYFYHLNHTRARGDLISADDFGIDKTEFVLLHKIPALWNAARNLLMDEHEYLYQKSK